MTTGSADRRNLVLLFLLTSVAAGPAATAAADPPPETEQASLLAAPWTISVLSYRLTGTSCWLADTEGFVRLEIRQDSTTNSAPAAVDLSPLLDQQGEGWTLVLGRDREGTFNRWGREWRRLPPSLYLAVQAILADLTDSPVGTPATESDVSHPAWQSRRPGAKDRGRRLELPPLVLNEEERVAPESADLGFRRRFSARGRGRGGNGEVLSLVWTETDRRGESSPGRLEVRSTRRPGVLRIQPPTGLAGVEYLDPEVFAPLWPLRELITLPDSK